MFEISKEDDEISEDERHLSCISFYFNDGDKKTKISAFSRPFWLRNGMNGKEIH